MFRREFLKASALTAAVGFSATLGEKTVQALEPLYPGQEGNVNAEMGDEPVEHFTVYNPDYADKNLWVRRDNEIFTVYRTNPNQKYPYLYPLVGPASRVSVTSESAQPWPHQRSLFLGVDTLNGGNYWQETRERGQVLSQGVELVQVEKNLIEWSDRCLWKQADQDPIVEDHRRYLIDWRCDDYYILDSFFHFEALTDLHIDKTNHGFFAIRTAQDVCPYGGGHLVNSDGIEGEEATFGKTAKWVAFYGSRRFNRDITEGIALLCPPKPFENCPWFTRDYGNCSPMPFYFVEEGFNYAKGETMDAVYRTVVFTGTPKDVDLTGLWNEIYG